MNYNNPEQTLEEVGFNRDLEKEKENNRQKEIDMKNKKFNEKNKKIERTFYNGNCYSWGFEKWV